METTDLPAYYQKRIRVTDEGCWYWLSSWNTDNYAITRHHGKTQKVARLVFAMCAGRPPRYTIEHACHTNSDCHAGNDCPHRRCINPAHMIDMPFARNSQLQHPNNRLKMECSEGHPLTPDNVYVTPKGHRQCLTCRRITWRKYRAANRDKVNARRRKARAEQAQAQ